ncbi:MAG: DUF4402 domain-containing protein [Alphaproteobacteria bacterium]|nr:DUF4402 domain-containing protein [Alphaproteobacteria bacterium]
MKCSIFITMLTDCKHKNPPKYLLVKLSLATVLSVFPGEVFAQSLNCFESLIFGELVTCGSPGSVTVRPDNSTTSSCVTVGSAPQTRGRCVVTQSFPFRPIQVNVSGTTTINNGGNSMSVTNVNIVTNSGGTGTTVTAPFLNVPIGATLNVGATQASGTYSGALGVTAILQ